MSLPPASPPRLQRWVRYLHLCAGLFVSPFVAVFAVSAILYNHPGRASPAPTTSRQVPIRAPSGLTGLELARDLMRQTNVRGEVVYLNVQGGGSRLSFPVDRPTHKYWVRADLTAGTATVEERRATWAERLTFLHKYPGPHLLGLRGNWVFTRVWAVLSDASVYLLLLASVTGIYLWLLVRSQRRAGLLCLAAGCVSFVAVLLALTRWGAS
jgi:hypothetical protein